MTSVTANLDPLYVPIVIIEHRSMPDQRLIAMFEEVEDALMNV